MPSLRPLLKLVREKASGSSGSKQMDNRSREGRSTQPIRLTNFSFGREDKRNGFARLGTGERAGRDKDSDTSQTRPPPEDGIAVRKDIWVVNQAA